MSLRTPSAGPSADGDAYPDKWLAFTAIGISFVTMVMSMSMVFVALSAIADDFGITLRAVTWVVIAQALTISALMLPILRLLDVDGPAQEVGEAAQDANTLVATLALILAVAVMAPLTEEIVFRGVLLGALLRKYGENAAVLLSAAAFAIVHLLDPGSYLIVPALFIVGVVLAALRMQGNTLGLVIMVHVGFNLTAVIGLLIPQ